MDNWKEERKLVLFRLDAMDSRIQAMAENHDKKLDQLLEDVSALKVKAGFWGSIAGAMVVLISIAINYLRYK